MKKRGEITVFLTMILVCVSALICVMLESARTEGARCYLRIAANSSLDSLLSQYHRQLWESYHLLGLEYNSELEVSERFQGYLDTYLETENWYPMKVEDIQIEDMKRLTDDGGMWLEKEILAYMKYGIWSQLDIKPQDGDHLWENIKESASMREVTDAYEMQSEAVWALEKTLEKIHRCLAKQKEYYQLAMEALSSEDGSGFRKNTKKLETEIQKIPKLAAAYEKQADRLKDEIEEIERVYQSKEDDLREDMSQIMGKELIQYQAYVKDDGERRKEIVQLPAIGEGNLLLIEDINNQVEQIEDYVSSLDEEDEDNSASMWESARDSWGQFSSSKLIGQGARNEETKGWLQKIRAMVDTGMLELVMPEGMEVSVAVFDLENGPSAGKSGSGETDKKNLLNRVLVNEYCAMHFSTVLEEKGMVQDGLNEKMPHSRYEMEYLLGGKASDRENLEETVMKVLMIREGLNLMYLFSDSQKHGEARALAMTITGALGMTPLVEITALFIMSVWALGESIGDVKALLMGKKIQLLKGRADWRLGLEQLLEIGKGGFMPDVEEEESGFAYEGYLKLLLLGEESERKYYRMMDVIQRSLKRNQSGFLLESCAYRVDIHVRACGKHVFFSMPFVENITGSREHEYQLETKTEKAY